MKQVSVSSTDPTTIRRTEAKIFRVEPQGIVAWAVYLVGDLMRYEFLSQQLATIYAQKLARENRPSVVIVTAADGTAVQGWEFPVEDQAVA